MRLRYVPGTILLDGCYGYVGRWLLLYCYVPAHICLIRSPLYGRWTVVVRFTLRLIRYGCLRLFTLTFVCGWRCRLVVTLYFTFTFVDFEPPHLRLEPVAHTLRQLLVRYLIYEIPHCPNLIWWICCGDGPDFYSHPLPLDLRCPSTDGGG